MRRNYLWSLSEAASNQRHRFMCRWLIQREWCDGDWRWRSSSRPFSGAESGSPGRAVEAGKRGSPGRAVQAGIRGKRLIVITAKSLLSQNHSFIWVFIVLDVTFSAAQFTGEGFLYFNETSQSNLSLTYISFKFSTLQTDGLILWNGQVRNLISLVPVSTRLVTLQ